MFSRASTFRGCGRMPLGMGSMGQTDSVDYTDYTAVDQAAIGAAGAVAVALINQNKPAAPTYILPAASSVVATGSKSMTPLLLAAGVVGLLYLASEKRSHPAGH